MKRYKAAVVGLGYWGPNLARNIVASKDFELAVVCDRDAKRLQRVQSLYPVAQSYSSLTEAIKGGQLDLVAIATPVATHFELAKQALESGANVLIEKPMCATVKEATALVSLAEKIDRKIFVDHTFLFTSAVASLKQHVNSASFGEPLYIDSVRINLGLFQPDVDVIWDLAPHDLSIVNHVLGRKPLSVVAMGSSHNPRGFCDVAYLHLDYGNSLTVHLHLSWLSPVKVRRMIFAGTESSILFDDLEPNEKLKIYEHGVNFDINDLEARREVLVSYRRGDMRAPAIGGTEALASHFEHIGQVLGSKTRAVASGTDGLDVVRILEAASKSLADGGTKVLL